MAGLLDLPADTTATTPDSGQFAGLLADPNNQLAIGLLAAGGPTTDPNASGFGARIQSAVLYAQKQKAAQLAQQQQAATVAMALQKQRIINAAMGSMLPGGGGPGQGVAPQPGAIPLNGGPGMAPNSPPSQAMNAPGGGPGAAVAMQGGDPGGSGAVSSPVASGGPGAGVAPVVSPAATVAPAGSPGTGLFADPSKANALSAVLNISEGRDFSPNIAAAQPKWVDVGNGRYVDTNPITNPSFHGGQQLVVTPGQRGYAASQTNPDGSISLPAGALDTAKAQADTFNTSKAQSEEGQGVQGPNGTIRGSRYNEIQLGNAQLAAMMPGGAAPPSGGPGAGVAPPAPVAPRSPGGAPGLVGNYTNGLGENLGQVGQTNPAPVGKFALLPNGQVDVNRAQAAIDAMPGLNVPPMAVASARAALAQQIAAQKPLIAQPPAAAAAPAAPASSGNPALDGLLARNAAIQQGAIGTAGLSDAAKAEIAANSKAAQALQTEQFAGATKAQTEAAAKSWTSVSTYAQNAPRVIALAQELQQISAGKNPATAAFADTDYGRKASVDAAEYQKKAAQLQSLVAPGGQGTDASRQTIADSIPPFGYRDPAVQAGLGQIIQMAQGDAMRGQVLAPQFTSNKPTAMADYLTKNQEVNTNLTPAVVPVIQQITAMPAGPAKALALKAFAKQNPTAASWAAENGILK